MRRSCFGILVLLSPCVLVGQLDPYSLTITASRSVRLQPDQVMFAVTVHSSLDTGLDEVVSALQGSGITTGNLSALYGDTFAAATGMTNPDSLQWVFQLPVALSKMTDTITLLNGLRRSIARKGQH